MTTINWNLRKLSDSGVEELLLSIASGAAGDRQRAYAMAMEVGVDALTPYLIRALRSDDNADLRNGAMEVLVHYGDCSVPYLLQLLRDENEEVRNFSTIMLGTIGSRDAVAPLIEALQDPDINVRHGAAEALGKIGDVAALQPLTELLGQELWLQHAAINALAALNDVRALPYLAKLENDAILSDLVNETVAAIWSALHAAIYGHSGGKTLDACKLFLSRSAKKSRSGKAGMHKL